MERRESLGARSPVCHVAISRACLAACAFRACLSAFHTLEARLRVSNLLVLSGRHVGRYTTHHFDNFHLSFDPKLVHEGLQVFLHLNTVVFELCFQLSQEKHRFKYN